MQPGPARGEPSQSFRAEYAAAQAVIQDVFSRQRAALRSFTEYLLGMAGDKASYETLVAHVRNRPEQIQKSHVAWGDDISQVYISLLESIAEQPSSVIFKGRAGGPVDRVIEALEIGLKFETERSPRSGTPREREVEL